MFSEETRRIILNVLEYFQNEKENSVQPISALKCTAAACKISEKTVARIRKEFTTGTSPKVSKIVWNLFIGYIPRAPNLIGQTAGSFFL